MRYCIEQRQLTVAMAIIQLQRSVKTMEDKKYKVFVDDKIFAEYMSLETAMILVKALFDTYYNEYGMTVSVREDERATVAEGA